jgi:hypothetical protein
MPATAIKERPIPFTGEMVRAILDGRKTQSRRVVNPQPERWIDKYVPSASPEHWLPQGVYISDPAGALGRGPIEVRRNAPPVRCPYGKPGDRLWVREGFRYWWDDDRCRLPSTMAICRGSGLSIPDPDAFVRLWQQSTDDAMRAGRQTDAYGRYELGTGLPNDATDYSAMATRAVHMFRWAQPHHARNHRGSGCSGCRRSARGTPKLRGAALAAR